MSMVREEHRAPIVNLRPDVWKIIEAISFIISEAARRNETVTQYDIVKTLFIADKAHLNKFGRPITFDNYVAMKDGPVPSLSYSFLKEDKAALAKHHIDKLPWIKEPDANNPRKNYFFIHKYERNDDVLSVSDFKALEDALTTIKSLTFQQIKTLTHDDHAYEEAWRDEDRRKAFKMSLGMLFDAPDYEAAEIIEFASKHR